MSTLEKRRSFKDIPGLRYGSMLYRIKTGGWNNSYMGLEICAREEFLAWATNDPEYARLYGQWKASGYKSALTPSIDRIDNDKGYLIGNMQWLTLADNSSKSGCKKNYPRARQLYHGKYRGVWRLAKAVTKPWAAQIWHKGKSLKLGCFATEEEAALAYNRHAKALRGLGQRRLLLNDIESKEPK